MPHIKLLNLDLLSLLLDMFEQKNLHMLLDKLFQPHQLQYLDLLNQLKNHLLDQRLSERHNLLHQQNPKRNQSHKLQCKPLPL